MTIINHTHTLSCARINMTREMLASDTWSATPPLLRTREPFCAFRGSDLRHRPRCVTVSVVPKMAPEEN